MSFPRYPKYRIWDVEWLHELPEEWELKRLRFLCTIRKGRLPGETFPSSLTPSDVPYLSMEYLRGETDNPYYIRLSPNLVHAENGDILLVWDGSNAGEFLRAKRGVVSSTVALIKNKEIERDFLFFVCKALEQRIRDQTVGMGIPHVSGDELRSFSIPYPDRTDQTQIAEFLGRETAGIDALINEQRQLKYLLTEKIQALLFNAVTKGVDSPSSLKSSHIDSFGSVPAHWKIVRLRTVCSAIFLGLTTKVDYVEDGGVPLVRALNIADGVLDLSDARCISEEQHRGLTKRNRAIRGDVLLSKSGSIGTAAIVDTDTEFSIYESIFALRARGELLTPRYLLYLLRSQACLAQYTASLVGMGVDHLNMSDIIEVRIALPPLDEQARILSFIENQAAELEMLIAEVERSIISLEERRNALVSAAVTGKIDVRGLVPVEAEAA
jgi:type I restriction enzyme S subunit